MNDKKQAEQLKIFETVEPYSIGGALTLPALQRALVETMVRDGYAALFDKIPFEEFDDGEHQLSLGFEEKGFSFI